MIIRLWVVFNKDLADHPYLRLHDRLDFQLIKFSDRLPNILTELGMMTRANRFLTNIYPFLI
ncbi:hypothetical protein D3C76_896690 [compost metagenome]